MLYLKEVINSKKCEICIDYYVPFTIKLENKKPYSNKVCWRSGNFKKSLIEISMEKENGVLSDITLVSVDNAVLTDTSLDNINLMKDGVPVFSIKGNIKNGLCDQVMDFYVYLNTKFIMVNLNKQIIPCKYVKLEKVLFGFDKDCKLNSIILKDLSDYEYKELKTGLNL